MQAQQISLTKYLWFPINREGWREGVCGAASPILIGPNSAIAAVAILGPAERLTLKRLQECGEILCAATRQISHQLGYDPVPEGDAKAPAASTVSGRGRRSRAP